MSLTAASGLVVFLLSVQVIQGQNGWGVTYTSTQICALKGSTVEMSCTYTYPSRIYDATVEKTLWFTHMNGFVPVDLRTDSKYTGRLESSCSNNFCTLTITDLRESDSAEYKFRFITNQPDRRCTGEPGVTLYVTDPGLQVQVSKSFTESELKCHSSCHLPDHPSYIWFKNGQKIQTETSSTYSVSSDSADSYSCVVKGLERFPSPSVCVRGQTCNRVTYTDRSICAVKGSSVDISCTYNSYYTYITSKFWFSPERSHQWQNPSQPEDLSEDSQYAGRVEVFETWRGRSTLRITDLRESDSAEYHFKFIAGSFEWMNSLPGTTLTVTDPDLQVQVIRSVYKNYTEVELKCHSSCHLPDRPSYIWFKNGQKIQTETSSSYSAYVYPADSYSCALKGLERFPSPSVYAPKLPSVSVSPSAEIVEGSSVTLTCSSDANPAANYTWYKENEDSPKASGQNFTITDFRAEHSGNYYCEAQNRIGRHNSTLHLIIVSGSMKSLISGSITSIFLAVLLLCAFLLIRRKRSSKETTEPGERPDNTAQLNMGSVGNNHSAAAQREPAEESDELCYANVSFSKKQEDSNIRPAQPNKHKKEEEKDKDGVEYSVVNFKSSSVSAELGCQEALENSSSLYSTITDIPSVSAEVRHHEGLENSASLYSTITSHTKSMNTT